MFPVGWSWTECRPRTADTLPFESDAEELGLLKIEPPAPQTKEGLQALRRSNRYRLAKAEQRLRRFIYRREVRVIVIAADGTKRDIDDRTRLDPTLAFELKKDRISVTRKERHITWGFETDALDLVGALETKLHWRGNNTANDWLRLERYLRELFETKGVPSTRQTYFAEAAIWWSANTKREQEPPKSKLQQLTSDLFSEYSDS